jgi:hypothetical protein
MPSPREHAKTRAAKSSHRESSSGDKPHGDDPLDPAYPQTTPPDPVYPGQTRAPLRSPLDQIATPSTWSRLAHPLERTLATFWQCLALRPGARPTQWVAIHYGRIALNAHACERLRARAAGRAPDPGLVEPASGWLARGSDTAESLRARLRRGALEKRLARAEKERGPLLERALAIELGDLDAGELARGPIDERAWTEILLPWLARGLFGGVDSESDSLLRSAISLEQRCGAELGGRLAGRRTLAAPAHVAYLTIEERIRAVHDGAAQWAELASLRLERVEQFARLDLPLEFWGRPRPEAEKP